MSKSILQRKDGRCYLCMALHSNEGIYSWTEEHHVFEGTANRRKSEHWGLKIYLCNEHHNQTNKESIHNNEHIEELVKKIAQKEFESKHGHKLFMQEFMKNYLDEDQWYEPPVPEIPKKKTIKEIAKERKNPEGFKLVEDATEDFLQLFSADNSGQISFAF